MRSLLITALKEFKGSEGDGIAARKTYSTPPSGSSVLIRFYRGQA